MSNKALIVGYDFIERKYIAISPDNPNHLIYSDNPGPMNAHESSGARLALNPKKINNSV